jgi:hypothetical protein
MHMKVLILLFLLIERCLLGLCKSPMTDASARFVWTLLRASSRNSPKGTRQLVVDAQTHLLSVADCIAYFRTQPSIELRKDCPSTRLGSLEGVLPICCSA